MYYKVFLSKEDGLTAVELILVIALISIVMLTLNSAFISGYRNYVLGNERAEIQRSARLINKVVNDNVRYAESIKIKNISRPSNESDFDEVIELESDASGRSRLIYNGRAITEYIITDINNISISSTSLEFNIEFINDSEMKINTLLNNMD